MMIMKERKEDVSIGGVGGEAESEWKTVHKPATDYQT